MDDLGWLPGFASRDRATRRDRKRRAHSAWYSLAYPARLANAGIGRDTTPRRAVRSPVTRVPLEEHRPPPGRSQRNGTADRRRSRASKRIAARDIRAHLEGSARRSRIARSATQLVSTISGKRSVPQRTMVLLRRTNSGSVGLHRRAEAVSKKCRRERRQLCLIPAHRTRIT